MAKLPSVSGKKAVAVFEKAGYVERRVSGSHHIMKKQGCPLLSVPVHGNKDLKSGTLRGLIRDSDLTEDEFIELL